MKQEVDQLRAKKKEHVAARARMQRALGQKLEKVQKQVRRSADSKTFLGGGPESRTKSDLTWYTPVYDIIPEPSGMKRNASVVFIV